MNLVSITFTDIVQCIRYQLPEKNSLSFAQSFVFQNYVQHFISRNKTSNMTYPSQKEMLELCYPWVPCAISNGVLPYMLRSQLKLFPFPLEFYIYKVDFPISLCHCVLSFMFFFRCGKSQSKVENISNYFEFHKKYSACNIKACLEIYYFNPCSPLKFLSKSYRKQLNIHSPSRVTHLFLVLSAFSVVNE